MEPDVLVVGGLFDNILKGLLGNLKPDLSKIDKTQLKTGVGLCLDSLKPTMTGTLDDMLIDAAKSALNGIIDGLGVKADDKLVVGAKHKRTAEEVEEMIKAEGGDPKQFAPWLLLALQFLPTAVELIRKLLGK